MSENEMQLDVQHILDTHHVFMRSHLRRLVDLFDKVISGHGERHGKVLRSVQRVFSSLKAETANSCLSARSCVAPLHATWQSASLLA